MTTTNTKVGALIRQRRRAMGLTQEELAKEIGKSRKWLLQVERGLNYTTEKTTYLSPDMCVKLAAILDVDPVDMLLAADIPKGDWPNFSYIRSNSVKIQTVDITTLTPAQAKIIRDLADEFKALNLDAERTHESSGSNVHQLPRP